MHLNSRKSILLICQIKTESDEKSSSTGKLLQMQTTCSFCNEYPAVQLPLSRLYILAKFPQYQPAFSQFYVGVFCTACNVNNCENCHPKDPNVCLKCDSGYSLFAPNKCKKGCIDILPQHHSAFSSTNESRVKAIYKQHILYKTTKVHVP